MAKQAKKNVDTKKTLTSPVSKEAAKELAQVAKTITEEQPWETSRLTQDSVWHGPVENEPEAKPDPKAKEKAQAKASADERKAKLEDTRRRLLSLARQAGLQVEERGGVWKLVSDKSKLWMSVSKKGTTLHLVGFNVDSPLVEKISPEAAKARHIGNVRGEADLSADPTALESVFAVCLAAVKVAGVLALMLQ